MHYCLDWYGAKDQDRLSVHPTLSASTPPQHYASWRASPQRVFSSIPQGAQWTDDPFRTDSTSSAQGARPRQRRTARPRAIPTQFHEEAEPYASLTRRAGGFPLTTSLRSRPPAATPSSRASTLRIRRKLPTSSLASIQNKPRLWEQQPPSAMTRYARGLIAHGSPQIASHSLFTQGPFLNKLRPSDRDSFPGFRGRGCFCRKASSVLGGDYEDWKKT